MKGRGYQFVHTEGFARKADARGRSVDYVLSEAERRPDSCQHIAEPHQPELIFGSSLAHLRERHDARAAEATLTIASGKSRKIRTDQLTLLTVIASHPAEISEVQADPTVAAHVSDWEQRVVAWLQAQWGNDLAAVVRHTDEKHAHLHAYILPGDAEMRARRLHPGVVAKEGAKFAAIAGGADSKAANSAGDAAYRAAMRGFQDQFWHEVGVPCGLSRIGPGRRRLTRAQWHAEQAGVGAAAEALRMASHARAEAEAVRQETEKLASSAEAENAAAEALRARAKAAVERAREAVRTARKRMDDAKNAANFADIRRCEAEQQARLLAIQGNRQIKQARNQAHLMLEAARAEAARTRSRAMGLGAWIGALINGLRGAAPALVAQRADLRARAEERKSAAEQIAVARADADRTRQELRKTLARLSAASGAAVSLASQRDRLTRELQRLRPPPSTTSTLAQRPR
jgi:hypothetical protein